MLTAFNAYSDIVPCCLLKLPFVRILLGCELVAVVLFSLAVARSPWILHVG